MFEKVVVKCVGDVLEVVGVVVFDWWVVFIYDLMLVYF